MFVLSRSDHAWQFWPYRFKMDVHSLLTPRKPHSPLIRKWRFSWSEQTILRDVLLISPCRCSPLFSEAARARNLPVTSDWVSNYGRGLFSWWDTRERHLPWTACTCHSSPAQATLRIGFYVNLTFCSTDIVQDMDWTWKCASNALTCPLLWKLWTRTFITCAMSQYPRRNLDHGAI